MFIRPPKPPSPPLPLRGPALNYGDVYGQRGESMAVDLLLHAYLRQDRIPESATGTYIELFWRPLLRDR